MSFNTVKRKRPNDEVVYSQPADTGSGEHVYTRFTYAVDHLRIQRKALSFEEIMSFLGVREGEAQYGQLRTLFRAENHDNRIQWLPSTNQYRYKPKLDIANPAQLKAYLQQQKSAKGLAIKDLKDGWPTVAEDIQPLVLSKQILLQSTSVGAPKTVWDNDPSLMHTADPEFANEWHKIAIPANPDDLRAALMAANLKAASAPRQANNTGPKQKKKRAPRQGGKQTNTHMVNVLKDYSGMRK
jgi:transcription initiation factor TFIIE subunit beta